MTSISTCCFMEPVNHKDKTKIKSESPEEKGRKFTQIIHTDNRILQNTTQDSQEKLKNIYCHTIERLATVPNIY